MSTDQPPTVAPAFRDQSTGLMVMGIFQIQPGRGGSVERGLRANEGPACA